MSQAPGLEVSVVERRLVATGVLLVELRARSGSALPGWLPGAHIDIVLPNGMTRQYSLCGDCRQLDRYRVAVLLAPAGRGGSAYVHDRLALGQELTISHPRNNFEFSPSARPVFIAGGIGITPLLPMMALATEQGNDWVLWYGGRSRDSMAFVDDLTERYGSRVKVWPLDERGLLPVAELAREDRDDASVYCCGPEGLIAAVVQNFAHWPAGSIHIERFSPKTEVSETADTAFEIRLARRGINLTVPVGRTILEVLSAAGVPVRSSCREGTCGTCEVRVLDGSVDHRDSILGEDEQAANDTMMVCVSRSSSKVLTLDL